MGKNQKTNGEEGGIVKQHCEKHQTYPSSGTPPRAKTGGTEKNVTKRGVRRNGRKTNFTSLHSTKKKKRWSVHVMGQEGAGGEGNGRGGCRETSRNNHAAEFSLVSQGEKGLSWGQKGSA